MAGRAIYDWLKLKKKIFSETTCEMKLFLGRNVPLIWPFKNCVFFLFCLSIRNPRWPPMQNKVFRNTCRTIRENETLKPEI
jgi:hypothetical protein